MQKIIEGYALIYKNGSLEATAEKKIDLIKWQKLYTPAKECKIVKCSIKLKE